MGRTILHVYTLRYGAWPKRACIHNPTSFEILQSIIRENQFFNRLNLILVLNP